LQSHLLGQLTCEGESDQRAQIAGRLYRLSDPVTADLGVGMNFGDYDRVVRWWGRILTVRVPDAESVVIDATQGDEDWRRQGEQFIDKVLAKIAG
jgi:hypothetical protein